MLARCAAPRRPCVFNPRASGRIRCVTAARASKEDLQKDYGIQGYVKFETGPEGLVKAVLKNDNGNGAEVYLHGATVSSWTQSTGSEILFMRPDAKLDGSKPISGGIPHCFPQFGPGAIQQHGFARNVEWAVGSTSADLQPDERDPCIELVLQPSAFTEEMWPHKFKLVYTVTLHGTELQTDYRVINEDEAPFDFTAALHTYFEVLDLDVAAVKGMKGLTYLDKAADAESPAQKTEARAAVKFGDALVDSVYLDAPEFVQLDVGTGAAVSITSSGWSDCVLWNPHESMECYQKFVCVENAQARPVTVQPGKDWRATTVMDVIDL